MEMGKYNLTYPQKNIWLVEKIHENTPINIISGTIEIEKEFDAKACQKAIHQVIKNNEAMRIRIVNQNGVPLQEVLPYEEENIEVVELSLYSDSEKSEFINDWILRPLFLGENGRLYQFIILDYGSQKGAILMKVHHIISDAWSCGKIGTELISIMEQQDKEEEVLALSSSHPSYVEYIQTEKEYEKSEKYLKDEAFWQAYLKDIAEPVSLKDSKKENTTKAKRYHVGLTKLMSQKIKSYCSTNKITPYILFLSALSTYMYRVTGKKDFIIGTPVLNRSNFREKQMIGMFVSTLPMRIQVQEEIKFLEFAKLLTTNELTMFRHQKYPYAKMLEYVHQNSSIKSNLYNIAFSFQNAKADLLNLDKYHTTWKFTQCLQDELQIHITDMDNIGTFQMNYDYLVDIFKPSEIRLLHNRIMEIIKNAMEDTEVGIDTIKIMSQMEENKIRYDFNNTKSKYPSKKTFIDLFEDNVKQYPNKVALICRGEEITYQELNEKANALAHYLRYEKKIKANEMVSLLLNRSIEMIISIIAVLKAGGAYLPIDIEFPKDRIQYMLENSDSKLLITNINKSLECQIDTIQILEFQFENYDVKNLTKVNRMSDLVYMIYTSGTTGKPKGVMITHQNLSNLIFAATEFEGLASCNVWGAFSTYSFDISILETFVPLSLGKQFILATEEEQMIPEKMKMVLVKYQVEVLNMTPTRMKLLIDYDRVGNSLISLKKIMLGGETFPPKFYEILREKTYADIYDGYGPTEITVWSSAKLITSKKQINIGKSLPNMRAYILDAKNRMLPIGIVGELCIGGEGVAKGYYKNQEMTNSKFIVVEGERVYKTGDLAYYNKLGELEYVGRMDSQVKLHGLRIEIEEIENVARKVYGMLQVAVKIVDNAQICLYYTSKININNEELKKYLAKYLPAYMIPQLYMRVAEFNMTTLGKIDKNNLPKIMLESKYIAPKNALQETICRIVAALLQIEKIGIADNLFERGLDSLAAIELVTRLSLENINITYGNIFDYPTIEKLEEHLTSQIDEKILDNQLIDNYDYTKIDQLLLKNQASYLTKPLKNTALKAVLLTGVTGFLGAHLLEQLLYVKDVKIYCLIREKNNTPPKERIRKILHYYFDTKYDDVLEKRIFVVNGDITNKMLVEDSDTYDTILAEVDTVIHCAARVKHFGSKEKFLAINAFGTENIAKFCHRKHKKLIYISTLSVSGNMLEGGYVEQSNIKTNTIFNEQNLYIQQKLNNIYAYSKFLGERSILDLINDGLNAKIIRIGNITNRSYDMKFQKNIYENAFVNRLKSVVNIKIIPENLNHFYLEFSPVDYVAKAVIQIAQIDHTCNVYHLFNHKHIAIDKFIKILKKIGIDIHYVTPEQFSKQIEEYMKDEKKRSFIEGIIIDLSKDKTLEYQTNTTIKSDFTIQLLKKLGFEWPEITEEYVKNYMLYFKEHDYFEF